MPRKPNIPFGDKRRAELARINRNVENKQKNLQKRFGMKADFEKKTAADFASVKEFNTYLKQAQQFTKRAANKFDLVNPDNGQRYSFNVLKKVEKEVKRINRIKDREFAKIKNLPHREMGRATGLTVEEAVNKKTGFSDPKFENFKHVSFHPKDFAGDRDATFQLDKIKDRYKGDFIQKREELHYKNYLQSLQTAFDESTNPFIVNLPDGVWEIHDHIVDMGLDEFTRLFYGGMLPTIGFIYGPDERETKLRELRAAFLGE